MTDRTEEAERTAAPEPPDGTERGAQAEATESAARPGQSEPHGVDLPLPAPDPAPATELALAPAVGSAPVAESGLAVGVEPAVPASELVLAPAVGSAPVAGSAPAGGVEGVGASELAPAPNPVPASESAPAPGVERAPASESALAPGGVEGVPAPVLDAGAGGTVSASQPEPTATATVPATAGSVPGPAPVPEAGSLTPSPKNRRILRATLRWTAALLVFATVGAGTAYGIAGMQRTDVPGLGTASDGRWVYPTLTKPPLPSGSPGPLAAENKAGTHYADLRDLVLPAPKGATADAALRGTDGWLPTKDLLAEYGEKTDREELAQKFTDHGLRHIAARGWTTPDGTHTRVYLLQFDTAAVVDELTGQIAPYGGPGYQLRGAVDSVSDDGFPAKARIEDVTQVVYTESKPYGAEQTRHAYLAVGDVFALVVQSRKGAANPVPFQQTVTLQNQLLG